MENPTIIKLEYLEPLGLEDAELDVETPTTIKLEYIETQGTANTLIDVDNNDCKISWFYTG